MGLIRLRQEDEEWLRSFGKKPSDAIRALRAKIETQSNSDTVKIQEDQENRIKALEVFLRRNSGGQF